jgi:[citrate (pro-3S)-lyase] ligase
MKENLALYGIQFTEIKRKEVDAQPISASRVRKLLKEKKFDEIIKLVPPSIYNYLINRFNSK